MTELKARAQGSSWCIYSARYLPGSMQLLTSSWARELWICAAATLERCYGAIPGHSGLSPGDLASCYPRALPGRSGSGRLLLIHKPRVYL